MSHVDLFMPKPIVIPQEELEALEDTMDVLLDGSIGNLTLRDDERKPMSSFLEVIPVAIATGDVNRGMISGMLPLGRLVAKSKQTFPWLLMYKSVSAWLPWAEHRFNGDLNDDVDNQSLAVQRATQLLPSIGLHHDGICRRYYPVEMDVEIVTWSMYSRELGFSVFVINTHDDTSPLSTLPTDFILLPLKALTTIDWSLRDGFIVVKGDIPETYPESMLTFDQFAD